MPLYTYRCNDCNHQFDIRQRMSDDPLQECPTCEGQLRKVINSVGVVFKGSGFYVTDNKSNNSAAPTKNGVNGSSEGAGSSDTASSNGTAEKASAAKPEAKKSSKSSEKVTST